MISTPAEIHSLEAAETNPGDADRGYKMSGYGRKSGVQHLEECLNVESVWIKTD